MKFLPHYVHDTKCLPGTKYKQTPNQRVVNNVPRLEGTPDQSSLNYESQWLK